MSRLLIILGFLLFCFNYPLSNWKYPNYVDNKYDWWLFRIALLSIVSIFFLYANRSNAKLIDRVIIDIAISYFAQDVVDRLIFKDANFHLSDIFTFLFVFITDFKLMRYAWRTIKTKNDR